MNKNLKSLIVGIILFSFLFGGSYLWRQRRDNDIKKNSRFTFGKIFKQTGSLKSGNQWHYKFSFNNHIYEGYKSDHVDYKINTGDYFLINFSYKDPDHNKILYDYKLKTYDSTLISKVWEEIPEDFITSAKK